MVRAHRLDSSEENGAVRLGVECVGAAFPIDRKRDTARDRTLKEAGWAVLRYSGREISRDSERCAERVEAELGRLEADKVA